MKTSLQNVVLVSGLIIITALTACNNSGNAPAGSQGNSAPPSITEQGKALFQQNCVGCHGADGTVNPNPSANLQQIVIDSAGIIETIENGKGAMPSFKNALAVSDMTALVAYVKTLRK